MTQAQRTLPPPAAGPERAGSSGFRPDIEGLRGIAIGFVLLFHAGVPGWSGGFVGVDVFFVISGFLMTGFVLRQLERTGRAGFGQFYARRIRRILPAAATVLVATGAASLVILPWLMWESAAWDLFAAGTFWSNLRFAATSTDYLAADLAPSVVLNYWSLSLEEQFYLLWPALLWGLWLVAARARRPRIALAGLFTAFGLLSLAGGVWFTAVNQPWAFFAMPLRAWEFVAGGLIAISAVQLAKVPVVVRATAGIVGLVGLVVAALVTPEAGFPGWLALLPVAAAALLIAGGTPGRSAVTLPAGRVVGSWPLRAAGRISYSWYLWHWPVLVLATTATGGGLSLWQRCLAVGGSVIPAYATYRWVEEPIRHNRWALTRRGAGTVLAGSVLPVVLIAGLLLLWPRPTLSWPSVDSAATDSADVGSAAGGSAAAEVLRDPVPGPSGTLTPKLEAARDDLPDIYRTPCHRSFTDPTDVPECVFGDSGGEVSVMLLGDSHAAQWQPTLAALAEQNGWRFRSLTRSSCPVSTARIHLAEPFYREYTECSDWVAALQGAVAEEQPDLLLVSATTPEAVLGENGEVLTGEAAERSFSNSLQEQWGQWADQGIPVVVLRDTPWQASSIPECLATESDPAECATLRAEAVPPPTDIEAAEAAGAPLIDLTDSICGPLVCEPIRFNRIVWRDPHHLTASYAAALAPVMRERLLDHLPAAAWRSG